MALATLITLTDIQLAYGHHPLLDHADFSIQAGERIGLIGRNGAGKSSLLRLLDGRTLPDDGDIARSSGLRVTTVEQEPELDENATVFDVVCNTEGDHEDWQRPSRVRAVLEKLGLPADAQIAGLSGGTRKRVALARALVDEPDLLLLDEPTNHLDFDGIAWLEDMLRNWKGAAVIITHDRRFLDAVATRIVELDRGRLLSFPGNFSQWQERKAQWLESERLEQARFDKLLAQEEVWIRGRGSPPHPQRRPRASARAPASRTRRAPRARGQRLARAGRRPALRQARRRTRTRPQALRRQDRGGRLLDHHPAWRPHRHHRPQRRRQDHAAETDPGRDDARQRQHAHGHQRRGRLFRPDARPARRERDAGGHHQPAASGWKSAARASTS